MEHTDLSVSVPKVVLCVVCCYLKPEADQSHDDLSTDLKPLVGSYQTLKLFGQAHLLQTQDRL